MNQIQRPPAAQLCVAAGTILLSCMIFATLADSADAKWEVSLTAAQTQALTAISADSLRGHLSFIASDLLQGRPTPSAGEDIAAEYIAAQFRRAGLKPVGDDGYYQTVPEPALTSKSRGLPCRMPVPLHNVAGLLPGSDPALAGTYILLTAHYDGTGPRPGADPAQIWNAANDDGSGTVSVIEIASSLASLQEKPRRSILFMAFFGEEGGGFGSRYYASHPLVPLERTVAMINLEQVGRIDSPEGNQSRRATLTGFDFSDLGDVFRRAGELAGISVYKDEQNSDRYFGASDNLSLAEVGVPAHTVCVAFGFPDYHGAGDKWQKVDYNNMAATDRMIATAALILAQSDAEPAWNASNPKAGRYLDAWKKNHRN